MNTNQKKLSLAALCLATTALMGAANPGCIEVTKGGTGSGTVVSTPAGVDCGATCVAQFPAGAAVILTAQPGPGNTFAGWTGPCAGSGDTCTVSVGSEQKSAVAANFELDCGSCNSYPGLCANAVGCAQHCNVSDHFVQSCYRSGYDVSLDECQAYYGEGNKCEPTACEQNGCETCTGNSCQGTSPACNVASLSYCVDNCGAQTSSAQWCYELGQITQDQCEEVKTDGCTRVDSCVACYSYPGLCNDVEYCISNCNISSHFRDTCG